MWTYVRLCPTCRRVTMWDTCPNCSVATTPFISSPVRTDLDLEKSPKEKIQHPSTEEEGKQEAVQCADNIIKEKGNSSDDDHHKRGNMGLRVSGSSYPSCNKIESQMTITESQYQACLDQLKKVSAERDMLKEKVQAMEEQRVLGESTIRELIEENKKLRVAVEQAEVRLGITEIEQQSILAEAQQLRGSLNQSLRELERSRQTSTHVSLMTNKVTPEVPTSNKVLLGGEANLLSPLSQPQEREHEEVAIKRLFTTVPNSSVSTPTLAQVTPVAIVKINSPQSSQQIVETNLVNNGIYEDERNSLLASNKRLEARCYVLESQLQRLRERLLLQNL